MSNVSSSHGYRIEFFSGEPGDCEITERESYAVKTSDNMTTIVSKEIVYDPVTGTETTTTSKSDIKSSP